MVKPSNIWTAACDGNIQFLRCFLKNMRLHKINDIDEIDVLTRFTPLQLATANRHYHCVKLLMEYGADPNSTNFNGENTLHIACKLGTKREIVDLLLRVKCDPLLEDKNGQTPLLVACISNDLHTVKKILSTDESSKCDMVKFTGHPESLHSFSSGSCEKCWNFSTEMEEFLMKFWKKMNDIEVLENARKLKESFGR